MDQLARPANAVIADVEQLCSPVWLFVDAVTP